MLTHPLMSRQVLAVTAAVLAAEAMVLLLGALASGRWHTITWMLLLVAAGVLAPVLNASRAAALLGRIMLVITAALMGGFAVTEIASWAH